MGPAILAIMLPIGVGPAVERVEVLAAVESLRRLEAGMRGPGDPNVPGRKDRFFSLLQYVDRMSIQLSEGKLDETALLNFHTSVRDVMHDAEALAVNPVQTLSWRRAGAVLAHRVHAVVARRAANGHLAPGSEVQARANAALLQEQYRVLFKRLLMH